MARRSAPLVLRSVAARPRSAALAPTARRDRALRRVVGVAVLVVLSVVGIAPAALAGPADPDPALDSPIVSEGGTTALRDQLTQTQTAWLDAKVELDASVARQQELQATLAGVAAELETRSRDLGRVARLAFVSASHATAVNVLSNGSDQTLLDGLGMVDLLAMRQTTLIQQLIDTRDRATAAQAGIDREAAAQSELLAAMDARKQQAQAALCQSAGGCAAESQGVFSASASYVADPAPRNPDGSWPQECIPRWCSGHPYVIEKDVTGHPQRPNPITPRLAHLIGQAKGAGFTGYVTCYRQEDNGGEHPRGRACDFSVRDGGKAYGDQLAAFFIFNAERLGVIYIVWYRQIWLVSTGKWKPYSGCCDPSSMHTDHVHVSVR